MYYSTRNRRQLTLESLFQMPSEPESKPFYTFEDGDDKIEVLNDTFTLVLSRDIRKNARIAAQMSFAIARENPDLDVWYVNTYAGVALLKEAFAKELEKSGMALPEPAPEPVEERIVEPEPIAEPEIVSRPKLPSINVNRLYSTPSLWRHTEDGNFEIREELLSEDEREWWHRRKEKSDWVSPADRHAKEEEESKETEEENQPSMLLPNFFIHDVPLGTWNTAVLAEDIENRGRQRKDSATDLTTPQPPPIPLRSIGGGVGSVVVMNSFEFASMNRGQRERCVMQLAELRDKLGLTFVIFSHEMKRDLSARIPGRGPLGVVAAKAGSVQRLNDPFEHLIRSRTSERERENGSNQSGSGIIHEAQMRSHGIRDSGKRGRTDAEEECEYPEGDVLYEYSRDPWSTKEACTGDELFELTKRRQLKFFYNNHRYQFYTRASAPKESEVSMGTYNNIMD